MKKIHLFTWLFMLLTSSSILFAQGKIKRASLSISAVNIDTKQGAYKVQQSIGHLGIIGTSQSSNNRVFQGFLLLPLRPAQTQPNPKVSSELGWTVYPVPFDTYVDIKFSAPVSGEMTVRIINTAGQLMLDIRQLAKQEQRVYLDHLSEGKYILVLEVMGKEFRKQLLHYSKPFKTNQQ